ncbi:MAG: bacteriohopanetetrol glucosamine biosynthesis glycosyltransferase HpnI [Acidiferrobacteraceae bacterium]
MLTRLMLALPDGIRPLAGALIGVMALLYLMIAVYAMRRWGRRHIQPASNLPPVTVLKPLHGIEHGLYENLRSFCDQDYPEFQIIFGAHDADDPALSVARHLAKEFPGRQFDIVVDPHLYGGNHKASNLANMMGCARHEYVIAADADIRVGRDYLSCLMVPLQEPGTGVVTCLYRARPWAGLWSALGAESINNGFAPSVLVARLLGSQSYCSGATLGLRRTTLEAIGGFPAVAKHLADDYLLGALARRQGLRTVLSSYVVETTVDEPNMRSYLSHELRWLRTIRTLEPWGYLFSGITYALPVSLLGAALASGHPTVLILPFVVLVFRVMLYLETRRKKNMGVFGSPLWVIPVRDFVSFGLWIAGFASYRVRWRGRDLSVRPDGHIEANKE